MGSLPILSVIHTVNGGNNGYGLRNVTCKQTFQLDDKIAYGS